MTDDRADALSTITLVAIVLALGAGILFQWKVAEAVVAMISLAFILVTAVLAAAWLGATLWALIAGWYPRWWK